ncbi:MAG: recombinase family protein [Lachnospiraceae bacterium]
MEEVKQAAIYIRVSTNQQEELSPDSQKRLCLEYAKKHNMIVSNEYSYVENGISGKHADKRPKRSLITTPI